MFCLVLHVTVQNCSFHVYCAAQFLILRQNRQNPYSSMYATVRWGNNDIEYLRMFGTFSCGSLENFRFVHYSFAEAQLKFDVISVKVFFCFLCLILVLLPMEAQIQENIFENGSVCSSRRPKTLTDRKVNIFSEISFGMSFLTTQLQWH